MRAAHHTYDEGGEGRKEEEGREVGRVSGRNRDTSTREGRRIAAAELRRMIDTSAHSERSEEHHDDEREARGGRYEGGRRGKEERRRRKGRRIDLRVSR